MEEKNKNLVSHSLAERSMLTTGCHFLSLYKDRIGVISERSGKKFGLLGGKKNVNECMYQCLIRETCEELGCSLVSSKQLFLNSSGWYTSNSECGKYSCCYRICGKVDGLGYVHIDNLYMMVRNNEAESYVIRVLDDYTKSRSDVSLVFTLVLNYITKHNHESEKPYVTNEFNFVQIRHFSILNRYYKLKFSSIGINMHTFSNIRELMPMPYVQLITAATYYSSIGWGRIDIYSGHDDLKHTLELAIKFELLKKNIAGDVINNRIKMFYEDNGQWLIERARHRSVLFNSDQNEYDQVACHFLFTNNVLTEAYVVNQKKIHIKMDICMYYCNRLMFGCKQLKLHGLVGSYGWLDTDLEWVHSQRLDRLRYISDLTGLPFNVIYLPVLTNINNSILYGNPLPEIIMNLETLPRLLLAYKY